jgi:hypothetical protein
MYIASQYCNPDTSVLDILPDLDNGQLYYICYHITTNGKYPFVQIMLQLKDEFILPSVTVEEKQEEQQHICGIILKKIKKDLTNLRCNTNLLTEDNYKGIFSNNNKVYALIDVSSVDITSLKLLTSSSIWFALPTEIININSICNIPISKEVIQLFTYVMPELGVLYKTHDLNEQYLLPDIVYTGSTTVKQAEFQTLFGPSKEEIYYHFNCSFLELCEGEMAKAVSVGPWAKAVSARPWAKAVSARPWVEAINRFALFIENPIIFDLEIDDIKDIDDIEDIVYEKCGLSPCIIIQSLKIMLVKEYELFNPLSYHLLETNSDTLDNIIKIK